MSQINKGFQSSDIHIGTVKAGETALGYFVYNGPLSDIGEITFGCSPCTKIVDKSEVDGKTIITFEYKDDHVANDGARSKYPNGFINVSKSMTVWFNDNREKAIVDGTSTTTNPEKERTSLIYRADVSLL